MPSQSKRREVEGNLGIASVRLRDYKDTPALARDSQERENLRGRIPERISGLKDIVFNLLKEVHGLEDLDTEQEIFTQNLGLEIQEQAIEVMAEVRASRKRAQRTGREIKKLETKTRSIIAKLRAS